MSAKASEARYADKRPQDRNTGQKALTARTSEQKATNQIFVSYVVLKNGATTFAQLNRVVLLLLAYFFIGPFSKLTRVQLTEAWGIKRIGNWQNLTCSSQCFVWIVKGITLKITVTTRHDHNFTLDTAEISVEAYLHPKQIAPKIKTTSTVIQVTLYHLFTKIPIFNKIQAWPRTVILVLAFAFSFFFNCKFIFITN